MLILQKRKNAFLNNPENHKYISWKALVLLQKYVTRFDNIKPRKYSVHSVKAQKKLRKAVIRAREL